MGAGREQREAPGRLFDVVRHADKSSPELHEGKSAHRCRGAMC
jgi:hypothetical protein